MFRAFIGIIFTFALVITNLNLSMTEIKSTVYTLLLIFASIVAYSQSQVAGVPLSFGRALNTETVSTVDIPSPSAAVILENETAHSLAYRFAINIPVNFSFTNSGNTELLADGQKVWRLAIHAEAAKSLILYFDRFNLPAGGKLFVYNQQRTQMYGAYTSANNNSFGTFACPLIEGEALVLEYNAPSGLEPPDFHVSEVAYGFRGISSLMGNSSLTSSGKCEVNVNCSEGDNWQNQKRGVVKLITKDSLGHSSFCSGSMINNTGYNGIPYLLTADHCGRAARAIDISQWLFYFNYEMPGCTNTTPRENTTLLGAVKIAHGGSEMTGSDFFLVRLSESIPDSLHDYFNGWSREDYPRPSGTGIHHPWGDVKKISTYTTRLATINWPGNPNACHWQVYWAQTEHGHGVTEGGSSGSPIFNSDGLIAGTLTGGDSSCDSNSLNLPDYYGKFSWHWDQNGSDSAWMLKCWLDPTNSGIKKLGGWSLGIKDVLHTATSLYPNPAHQKATLNLENEGLPDEGISLSLIDLLGNPCQVPIVEEIAHTRYSFDLQSLSQGMYFVVVSGRKYQKSFKLIKM